MAEEAPANIGAENIHVVVNPQAAHAQVAVNPSGDISSPFYLHPGEGPGMAQVSTPLTEANYYAWSQAMYIALHSKNKLGFINGMIPELEIGNPLRSAWERNNTMILAWLNRSLSSEIALSVMDLNKALDHWDELRQRFAQGSHTRLADLQEEIYVVKQGNLTITSYYTQLKGLWGELENFRLITSCVCGLQCNC